MELTTHSLDETQSLGKNMGKMLNSGAIFALTGDLGSGKTSFVQGLAKGLDVSEKYYITSPTFTLINEYPGRYRLFHVDLYRIEHFSDLDELGFYDILASDNVIAIEWADRLLDDFTSDYIDMRFEILADESRMINIAAYGGKHNYLIKNLEHSKRYNKRIKWV
ncbi:MAG: tRNA (adenosine(37)-N6)-threonylcarbamoyltransferase complex ATPase subunit type 1 TsaE [Thermodesulfobacteriota bacterium]|nr:tRNA (adenosine(37)-N6)-threonylcarbamoyltransferase complex ATPase subunit type 1 TsaE [Thermodesulfobacteriota bacterium]